MLLRFEGVHLDRHFRRRNQIRHEDESPAAQLGAITEIEILGQGVVLPAAGIGNRGPSPHSGGAVEIEESAGAVTPAMLEHEMAVEENRLNLREQRVVL